MNSPPQSPNEQDNRELPMPSQQIRGRKKVPSNRTAVYRELLATRKKEREIEKYRKRLQRSKDRIPLQNVSTKNKLISNYAEAVMNKCSSNSRKERKRAIILTHFLTDNIKDKIKQNQNDRDKHSLVRVDQ